MRKLKQALLFTLILILVVPFTYSIELSLKISGGFSYLNLKNTNRSLQNWEERKKREALFQKNWEFRSGKVQKFHSGLDFEGEIIISLTSHLAAGFGTGYVYGELKEEKTELTVENPSGAFIYARPTTVSAIPLYLTGYYFFPIREDFNFFLKGGVGVIWAKYIEREGQKELSAKKFNYSQLQRASAQGTSFHGSLGFTYEIDPYVSLFVEGSARLSRITGFKTDTEEEENRDLFFFEEYHSDLDFWQAKNQALAEEPSGEDFRSVQKAVVDFSGFSVKIGLLIKF